MVCSLIEVIPFFQLQHSSLQDFTEALLFAFLVLYFRLQPLVLVFFLHFQQPKYVCFQLTLASLQPELLLLSFIQELSLIFYILKAIICSLIKSTFMNFFTRHGYLPLWFTKVLPMKLFFILVQFILSAKLLLFFPRSFILQSLTKP